MYEERRPLSEEVTRRYDNRYGAGLTTKIVTYQTGEHLSFESITFIVEKSPAHEGGKLVIDRDFARKLVGLMGEIPLLEELLEEITPENLHAEI